MGNGGAIVVGHDAWINNSQNQFIPSEVPENIRDALVADFIRDGSWDRGLVRRTFNDRDCDLILRIPLSINQGDDKNCLGSRCKRDLYCQVSF